MMLGIDVAKDTLAVCCWDPATHAACWSRSFANTPAGQQALLASTPASVPLVLEPTGRYGEALVQAALAQGRTVLAAPPLQAKRFLQSVSPRAKCDRVDAQGLAHFAASVRLAPYGLRNERQERLWQLLRVREKLARSIASFTLQQRELGLMQAQLGQILAPLRAQLTALDRELAQAARGEEAVGRLQRVCGIGLVTAVALALRLQQTPFATKDQFVAYLGLDLRVADSGQQRGRRRLSRRGDARLRWLLFLCAQASLRGKDSPFAHQYQREREKGLASTQAVCAVARKLAKVAWALIHSGQEYDPARVYARPPA